MKNVKWTRRGFGGLMCALAVTAMISPVAAKKEKVDDTPEQGSTPEEIAALKAEPLPQPNTIKVAILPFVDTSGSLSHVRMGTVANYLLWKGEGFEMVPVMEAFKAVEADKDLEPGLPLRRAEAVQLGKKVGADWAVYGEVRELRPYTKTGVFKAAKYLVAGVRISVVDVKSGETIYWHQRSEKTGGTGIGTNRHSDTLKRRGVVIVSTLALKPLFDAFPQHQAEKEPPKSDDIAAMVNQLWPDDKNN